jgi:diacylglycerol kinase family enzyme
VNSSRALIIVNPIAGGGRARRIQPAIADYFREQHWPAEFTVSASTEDLRRIAAEAIAAGYRCVAALGGDGAFHHLAEAAVGSPTILGFLPAGNGNDIAAGLGLPRDPIEAARVLVYGKPRAIDVVRFRSLEIESMQGGDARVQRSREAIFVGAGGAGLDAEAAQLANTRFKRWPGVTRYIAGALWAWRDFRAFDLAASIDGVPLARPRAICGDCEWSLLWIRSAHSSGGTNGRRLAQHHHGPGDALGAPARSHPDRLAHRRYSLAGNRTLPLPPPLVTRQHSRASSWRR